MGGISTKGPVSTASTAASGPARGSVRTGGKTFNIGNPNARTTGLGNPMILAAVVVLGGLYLWKRRR